MNEEPRFIDAEQYQGGMVERVTFRDIVLQQLQRITTKQTAEWRGGYFETKVSAGKGGYGITTETWIPDTRQEFINGVNCLHDILINYFDEEMSKEVEQFNNELRELKQKLNKEIAEEKISRDIALNEKAEFHRSLFRSLNKLLYRLHYLEGKTFEENA